MQVREKLLRSGSRYWTERRLQRCLLSMFKELKHTYTHTNTHTQEKEDDNNLPNKE